VGRIRWPLWSSRLQPLWWPQPLWRIRAAAWRHSILEPVAHQRSAYRTRGLNRGCGTLWRRPSFGGGSNACAIERSPYDDGQRAGYAYARQLVGEWTGGCAIHDSQHRLTAVFRFRQQLAPAIVPAADGAPAAVNAAEPLFASVGGRPVRGNGHRVSKHGERWRRKTERGYAFGWPRNEHWFGKDRKFCRELVWKQRKFAQLRAAKQRREPFAIFSAARDWAGLSHKPWVTGFAQHEPAEPRMEPVLAALAQQHWNYGAERQLLEPHSAEFRLLARTGLQRLRTRQRQFFAAATQYEAAGRAATLLRQQRQLSPVPQLQFAELWRISKHVGL